MKGAQMGKTILGRMCLAALVVGLACCLAATSLAGPPPDPPFLQILGAARTIGGSACLVQTGKERLLIDFGSNPRQKGGQEEAGLPVDPVSLDYVFVTHAHMDHAGAIPVLFRRGGFRGRVIATAATRELLAESWPGSLRIDREDGRADYDEGDIEKALASFQTVSYDSRIVLSSTLAFRLRNAGHILGSAMVELWIGGKNGTVKVVATGDMGSGFPPLLPPPAEIDEGDVVIVESTHGAVSRPTRTYRPFGEAVRQTLQGGGSVLIPAFTLDRTQKVLNVLGRLKAEGVIPAGTPVYVDSPGAAAVTRIYRGYRRDLANTAGKGPAGKDILSFPGLQEVTGGEALDAHDRGRPAIYVTASGMLDHGWAPGHLARMIGDRRNLLVLVGWQAPESLGASLLSGAGTVRIPRRKASGGGLGEEEQDREVRIRVRAFGFFSNHADGCDILSWLARFPWLRQVIVIHGEGTNAPDLARFIERNLGFPASAPVAWQIYPLSTSAPVYERRLDGPPCRLLPVMEEAGPPLDQ